MHKVDFYEFYNSRLLPSIAELRTECADARTWKNVYSFSAMAGIIALSGFALHFLSAGVLGAVILIVAFLMIVSFINYHNKKYTFTDHYKEVVIKQIIEEVCPGAVYQPGRMISEKEYRLSCLARYEYDYFNGDDYISGTYKNVPFHFSEIHTQADASRPWTIFKGYFLAMKINPAYNGSTYVWARGYEQLPVSIMDEYYRLMPMPAVRDINFGDPYFHENFRVCTTNSAQAGSILTAQMRENIIELTISYNRAIGISFVNGWCYVAVPYKADLLEPGLYEPADIEEIKKFFETVKQIRIVISRLQVDALQ